MTAAGPFLAARGVSKSFFGNRVLHEVSISLEPGRIHALLGENGAGKSTLINILAGALRPDAGTVEVAGRPVAQFSPLVAQRAGIAVVQQELSLAGNLSIAENIGLGAYPRRWGLIDYKALARMARAACQQVGLEEPLDLPVGELPLGRRQMVEIAKALFRNPKVLILDEPTSSLSAHETRALMDVLARLRAQGTAILYISHRLAEVMALCEHVTVLKDGACTADRPMAGLDADGLVRLMVGRESGDLFPKWTANAARPPVISVKNFNAGAVSAVDLEVMPGEIVGIGGLVGQGQEDLLLGLYGSIPAGAAAAVFLGAPGLPGSVTRANGAGIAYVPADRKREGLHLIHSILTNLMLPGFAQAGALTLRSGARERRTAAALAAQLGIKGDMARPVQMLSGGNQQKVALARWLPLEPKIFLLNDPTRGVDVETKREIYVLLRRLVAAGKAIVLSSSDTLELVHLCDRVAVIQAGQIKVMLAREALSEEAIVAAAMNTSPTSPLSTSSSSKCPSAGPAKRGVTA